MKKYLAESDIINFSNFEIVALCKKLTKNCHSDVDIVKVCFEYVRDEVRHVADYKDKVDNELTTYIASDVLKYKMGWCFSKSHLLAALLRYNKIPTGFCYQRMNCSALHKKTYCLHGFNAVYLKEFGWYRIDPRGNKTFTCKGDEGLDTIIIDAQFTPPVEMLAYPDAQDAPNIDKILSEPLDLVIDSLKINNTFEVMRKKFPDVGLCSKIIE
jgi:hypothetical protein